VTSSHAGFWTLHTYRRCSGKPTSPRETPRYSARVLSNFMPFAQEPTSWLFVIFGDHQVMAQLIAKRVLIALLINKDFQFATLSSLVAMLLP
jgi:hypothetical protein